MRIEKSTSDEFELEIKKIASGESQKQAKINAGKINYFYTLEEDELSFDNYFTLEQGEGFRFQEIELTLYIPKGKTVYLYNSTKYMIYDVDNSIDMYDEYMVNHHWKMSNFELNCTDCD